jgi:large subunit ribosomal protein L10
MTKAEKTAVIEELKGTIMESNFFYVTDCSTMTVAQVSDLRRECFEKEVTLRVAKNTLIRKALEAASTENEVDYSELYTALAGPSALMFTTTGNLPAKIIKKFRENSERPLLKAAYIDSDVFLGDDQLETLNNIKSKEDLIGEVITLLESPAKNVISALKSSGSTISGLLKTLEERGE